MSNKNLPVDSSLNSNQNSDIVTPSPNQNDSHAAYFTTMNQMNEFESPDSMNRAQHNSSSVSSTFSQDIRQLHCNVRKKISFVSPKGESGDMCVQSQGSSKLGHHNTSVLSLPDDNSYKTNELQLLREKIKQLEALNSALMDKVSELSSGISQRNTSEHPVQSISSSISFQRIHIYCDSMGRDIANLLRKMLPASCRIYSSLKPGALFRNVIKSIPKLCHDFTHQDVIIIIGGTNDMPSLCVSDATNTYGLCSKYFDLSSLNNLFPKTNVIVHNIPYRYDKLSHLSTNIYETNKNLKYKSHKNNFHLFESNTCMTRSHFTKHGLHYNKSGKKHVSAELIKYLTKLSTVKLSKHNTPKHNTPPHVESTITPKQVTPSALNDSNLPSYAKPRVNNRGNRRATTPVVNFSSEYNMLLRSKSKHLDVERTSNQTSNATKSKTSNFQIVKRSKIT
uniref:Uncharacterized protein n=1 Tax=Cacopsylla melanoneura TaxID=428564 RepID=A0A8D9E7U8_9HEMI